MLYLQDMVKKGQQTKTIILSERLPHFIIQPCTLQVHFQVEAKDDFYLAHLHVGGALRLQCQRCLDEFDYSYDNNTILAICSNEARAEKLLELYECIVSPNFQISLDELIIDELHLYAPQFHPEPADCSSEINQFLTKKNAS